MLLPILICLDATKFVLISVFILVETILPKIWAKPLPKNEKSRLPVDVRRSRTSLLKLRFFSGEHSVITRLTQIHLINVHIWGMTELDANEEGNECMPKVPTNSPIKFLTAKGMEKRTGEMVDFLFLLLIPLAVSRDRFTVQRMLVN